MLRYSSSSSISRVIVATNLVPVSWSAMCCSHWLLRMLWNLSLYMPSPRPSSITIPSSCAMISVSNSLKLPLLVRCSPASRLVRLALLPASAARPLL